MADKTTHFGRAGEFFAMSELLLRGWNVAVPLVDVGDDVFVIDDNDKTTYRMQIKSSMSSAFGSEQVAKFAMSRRQLRRILDIELFYMLLVRIDAQWRFLVIPREELTAIRDAFESAPRSGSGRPPLTDDQATSDTLSLSVELVGSHAKGWGADLGRFLDQRPTQLSSILNGPGARSAGRI